MKAAFNKQTKPSLNEDWYLTNKIPKGHSLEERIRWRLEHSKNCGCRSIPQKLLAIIERIMN